MNRIILIGNGFDLAHGLPTRYEDFINWYWERRLIGFALNYSRVDASDILCTFKTKSAITWNDVLNEWKYKYDAQNGAQFMKEAIIEDKENFQIEYSAFFGDICKSIETKGWVDIENEYYRFLKGIAKKEPGFKCTLQELNEQLACIQTLLIEYLDSLNKNVPTIQELKSIIYEPIKLQDVSVAGQKDLSDCLGARFQHNPPSLLYKLADNNPIIGKDFFNKESVLTAQKEHDERYEKIELQPGKILFLNFNYTENAKRYFSKKEFEFTYIHGRLKNEDSIIFGYGDELDKDYYDILNLNDNEYLRNMKFVKYLESSNYRNMLSFIESAPYQVYIMGHSCGNSDRTLLNTLFEHRNCVTIKPFYHQKDSKTDNYLSIVQNISRNFTDMKLMRDRVVNKTFCEPLPQNIKPQ